MVMSFWSSRRNKANATAAINAVIATGTWAKNDSHCFLNSQIGKGPTAIQSHTGAQCIHLEWK